MFWHPFLSIANESLTWWFIATLIGSGFCFFFLNATGRRLRTAAAPMGIVSLAMSETGSQSRRVISSWDDTAQDDAWRNLSLDYIFIPLYTTALALISIKAAHWFTDTGALWMSNLTIAFAWGAWLAGLLDVAENSALLRSLQVYPDVPDGLARMASWCARLKFLLIGMAALMALFGFVSTFQQVG